MVNSASRSRSSGQRPASPSAVTRRRFSASTSSMIVDVPSPVTCGAISPHDPDRLAVEDEHPILGACRLALHEQALGVVAHRSQLRTDQIRAACHETGHSVASTTLARRLDDARCAGLHERRRPHRCPRLRPRCSRARAGRRRTTRCVPAACRRRAPASPDRRSRPGSPGRECLQSPRRISRKPPGSSRTSAPTRSAASSQMRRYTRARAVDAIDPPSPARSLVQRATNPERHVPDRAPGRRRRRACRARPACPSEAVTGSTRPGAEPSRARRPADPPSCPPPTWPARGARAPSLRPGGEARPRRP